MRRLVVVLAAALLLAGCGGGEDKADKPSQEAPRVTDQQALLLARMLELNYTTGGADVTGTVKTERFEATFNGETDFRKHRGTFELTDPAGENAARRYYWASGFVLAQERPGSKRYVRQPVDAQNNVIHSLIQFIVLLSARTVDNIELIKNKGAVFLGTRTVGGKVLERYRYERKGRTTFWVDPKSGFLARVDARLATGPVISVTLADQRKLAIELPPKSLRS